MEGICDEAYGLKTPGSLLQVSQIIYRPEVFKFLKMEGKVTGELIQKLMKWKHSSFSLDYGVRIEKGVERGKESIAHYAMRNGSSTQKLTYILKTGSVLYR